MSSIVPPPLSTRRIVRERFVSSNSSASSAASTRGRKVWGNADSCQDSARCVRKGRMLHGDEPPVDGWLPVQQEWFVTTIPHSTLITSLSLLFWAKSPKLCPPSTSICIAVQHTPSQA